MRQNFWASKVLICAPVVVVILCAVLGHFKILPQLVAAEERRVRNEYREIALSLKEHPEDSLTARRDNRGAWSPVGRMAPGRWGFRKGDAGGPYLVWYQPNLDRDDVLFTHVEAVPAYNFTVVYWMAAGLVIALMCLMCAMGLRYLVNYARTRDNFMASAVHDLTTPLVGLRYVMDTAPEDARILNRRLLHLVENMKEFLHLQGRRPPPQRTPVDLRAAYREAYALFRSDFQDLGAEVQLHADGAACVACADETLVVQILWNLLGNALKYAATEGAVTARLTATATTVSFALQDEGPGLTAFERKHVFDRYYRAPAGRQRGTTGFGIGLCVAAEFAKAMGGSLTVQANRPKGTIFTLTLPKDKECTV